MLAVTSLSSSPPLLFSPSPLLPLFLTPGLSRETSHGAPDPFAMRGENLEAVGRHSGGFLEQREVRREFQAVIWCHERDRNRGGTKHKPIPFPGQRHDKLRRIGWRRLEQRAPAQTGERDDR